MSFPKFNEWMSLREEAPQVASKNIMAGIAGSKPKSLNNPKVKQAVANSLKKNKGKVNPNDIIDAVSKTGSVQDMLDVAKDVGTGS